jgi:hypothetical protein
MNDQSRLLLCRVGFLLFCLLPTIAVDGWIVLHSTDGFTAAQKAEWQRELTSRLGLVVEIGQVQYPHPGLARLNGFRLLEPETRTVIAEAYQLDVVATADGWQVAIAQLVVEGNELGRLARTIDERILRGLLVPGSDQHAIHISIKPRDSLIRLPGRDQTLEQLGGEVQLSAENAQLELAFRLPSANAAADLVRFAAIRDRGEPRPRTRWHLDTGGAEFPCRLAAGLEPELAGLGPECQFKGIIQLGESPGGVGGLLVGTLTQVDLDALVSERFSHQLSGLATVRIEQGLIDRGKLVELRGAAEATGGAISQSLVTAAAQHLELSAVAESQNDATTVIPFRRLALGFHLTGRSLALVGNADPTTSGALMANAAGPILTAPRAHSVAAVNLLRTLLPDNEYQVPATRQTAALIGLLPAPEVVPTKAASPSVHTPARLSPATRQPPQTAVRQPVLR